MGIRRDQMVLQEFQQHLQRTKHRQQQRCGGTNKENKKVDVDVATLNYRVAAATRKVSQENQMPRALKQQQQVRRQQTQQAAKMLHKLREPTRKHDQMPAELREKQQARRRQTQQLAAMLQNLREERINPEADVESDDEVEEQQELSQLFEGMASILAWLDCDKLDNNTQDPEFKAQVFKSFAKMRVRVEALAEHQTLSNEERVQLEAIKKAITDIYSYAHM